MQIVALPIVQHEVNWPLLLSSVGQALGRDISSAKDRKGVSHLPAYISTIEDVLGNEALPEQRVQDAFWSLRHLHLSFLTFVPNDVLIALQETNIAVSSADTTNYLVKVAFMSATLLDWKLVICNPAQYEKHIVRQFLNVIYKRIEELGFSRIFYDYKRRSQADGTFIIERK